MIIESGKYYKIKMFRKLQDYQKQMIAKILPVTVWYTEDNCSAMLCRKEDYDGSLNPDVNPNFMGGAIKEVSKIYIP